MMTNDLNIGIPKTSHEKRPKKDPKFLNHHKSFRHIKVKRYELESLLHDSNELEKIGQGFQQVYHNRLHLNLKSSLSSDHMMFLTDLPSSAITIW